MRPAYSYRADPAVPPFADMRSLAPRGDAYEYAEHGRFHFHVEIAHPFTGLIVAYRGWLAPEKR